MPNTLTKAITENFDGRILAYTALGADAVADSYTTTTSMVNVDGHGYINFVAPPSGNVEIFASVYVDTTSAIPLVFGLSDNLTYNAVDVTHEHIVYTGDETLEMSEFSNEEQEEFINSFPSDTFADIQKYFESMPKVTMEVQYKIKGKNGRQKTKKKLLQGINDFF